MIECMPPGLKTGLMPRNEFVGLCPAVKNSRVNAAGHTQMEPTSDGSEMCRRRVNTSSSHETNRGLYRRDHGTRRPY
jgi:hypothetical protein